MKTTFYASNLLFKSFLVGFTLFVAAYTTQVSAQTITVLSPNGGENWIQGSTNTISWELTGSPADVMIEFTEDGGNYWYTFVYVLASDSASSYTFQNYFYATNLAKVRVSLYSNPAISDESDDFFTITEPPVYIYSPYSGDSYYRTLPVYISWYSYTLTTFTIDYSLDNGSTWSNIVSNHTGFDYTWTAPDQLTDQAVIRIADAANPDSYGLSPVFSIVEIPTINLTAPNGGETWTYGGSTIVSWTGTNLPYYMYVDFSYDGGINWTNLGSGYSEPGGGSAEVWVPYIATENALVRVYDPSYEEVSDVSDAPFTVVVPPVLVFNPYQGQQIYNKSEVSVSWLAYDIDLINIEISPDNGQTWQMVAENINATNGYFSWTVMATPSENSVLRLSDATDPSQFGLSPVFTILETPVITLTAPAGGNILNTNTPYTISWTYDNPAAYYLYLDYSSDNGQTWNFIGYANYTGVQGSFDWVTPDISSEEYRVRIRDYSLYFVSDTSDAFTIISFPNTPICMVSVDSATNRNIVMWEKPVSELIEQFIVYKESDQANVYEVLATIAYDDPAMVTDTNSNPAVKPYRYKLGFSGMNGVIFPSSDFHQTIHLTINQGVNNSWNLIWTDYIGLEAISYVIHRKAGSGVYEQIASISASFNTYTDVTAPAGDVYYMVEMISPAACNPAARDNEYSSSFSNVATNSILAVDDEQEIKFSMYPNPADDHVNVTFGTDRIKNAVIAISDLVGKEVYRAEIGDPNPGTTHRINTSVFREGIYILQMISGDRKTSRKLIVNR